MYAKLLSHYNMLNIASKLRFLGVSTMLVTGVVSIMFFSVYKYIEEKTFLEKEVETLSKIVSDNIKAAILFNDNQYIDNALSSLKHKKRIKVAYTIDDKQAVIAAYDPLKIAIEEEILKELRDNGMPIWSGFDLYTIEPIINDGVHVGSLVFNSSIDGFVIKGIKEISILVVIVMFAVLSTVKFRSILIDSVLIPISELNRSTNEIIVTKNLSARIDVYNNDEIGELARNFKVMVATIQDTETKLRKYNEQLEDRVNTRTLELYELNRDLDRRVKEEVHKRAEQEQMLIQQSRFAAMGEMIGNIAHQWRQPLNALGLLLQNIENMYEMGKLDSDYMERAIKKGNDLTASMSQTIDDFRNFFKPNKESEVFCVAATLNRTLEMVRSSFENNMIDFSLDIDESLYIKGFPSEFSQVLLNIFNNAKDALCENRQADRNIYVRAYEDGDAVVIEISDNAGGIPETVLGSVFDPYFTTKDEGQGTGIGLYMSKTIIESNMKGTLIAANTKEGAKFTIKMKSERSHEQHT